MEFLGVGAFLLVWSLLMIGSFGGMICAVAALISISRTDVDAFGPWWDNIKTPWLLGVAVGFVVPFGALIAGVYWFWKGRAPLATTGLVARPFWVGPPKPAPWGYPMYPPQPYPPQPYGSAPAPHPPEGDPPPPPPPPAAPPGPA